MERLSCSRPGGFTSIDLRKCRTSRKEVVLSTAFTAHEEQFSTTLLRLGINGIQRSVTHVLVDKLLVLWIVVDVPGTVSRMTVKQEKVLVVPTKRLWDRLTYANRGLITGGVSQLSGLVAGCGRFVDRSDAETDPDYKQIIPYAVVRHLDSYFLLQRKSTQSEQRLHNKLSIGVGGHINPSEGAPGSDAIKDGLTREVNEELHIAAGYGERLIGLINDDTTDVGRVHLGVLYEIESPSFDVSVRETSKMDGEWVAIKRLQDDYDRLETWSQIVYDSYLCAQMPGSRRNGTAG